MMKRTQSELPHGFAMSMNLGLNRTFRKLSDDSGANANGAPVGAIAFASTAESAHDVALTGLSSSLTAADLLASHTTFSGGHALIT